MPTVVVILGYLPQARESEVLRTLIAERDERRSLGITSKLVYSEWERIFANLMATDAAIDRGVHPIIILEFDVPSYHTNAAQQRGQEQKVNPRVRPSGIRPPLLLTEAHGPARTAAPVPPCAAFPPPDGGLHP